MGQQLASVATHERVQHHRVAVDDLRAGRRAAWRQQLVAGDQELHTRAAGAAHPRDPDRGEQPGVLRPQPPPAPQHEVAATHVLADRVDVAQRRHRLGDGDAAVLLGADLRDDDGVRARRQRRAGHDPHGGAARHLPLERVARERLTEELELDRVVRGRAEGVLAADGVAVHGGPLEAGDRHGGLHVLREHAPDALEQVDVLGLEQGRVRVEEALDLLDVRPLGEAPHPHVTHGPILRERRCAGRRGGAPSRGPAWIRSRPASAT